MVLSIRQSIRAALDTRLLTVVGLPASRAWESVNFTPVIGTPWAQITLSHGRSRAVTMGLTPQFQHEGLYLVDLHYPVGNGPAQADAAADAVIAAFPVTADLLHSGVSTRIRWAERYGGYREEAWFKVPVSVAWQTFSMTP